MEQYGLIGYPLGHSFSQRFFTKRFEEDGRDAAYLNFEIPEGRMIVDVVREHPDLRGLNCTIPHKQAIIPYLDELDETAREIGAVNVVRITRCPGKNGEFYLTGFNSDIIGFTDSLRPLLKPHHRQALVLGTGGASKAVCVALDRLGIRWKQVSRTPRPGQFTYADVTADTVRYYPLIINCSPLGMYPHTDTCPDLPYEALGPDNLLFDLVYNPVETLFMERGAAHGATVKNGLEMLYLQAIASWKFWNPAE